MVPERSSRWAWATSLRTSVTKTVNKRRLLVTGAILLGLGAGLLIVWGLPVWLTRHPAPGAKSADIVNAQNGARTAAVALVGAVAAIIGVSYAARTWRLTSKNVRLAEQGQITDRYVKAVELLGHRTMQSRLGGIYALERLAKDSPDDSGTIQEVLAAFIRHECRTASDEYDDPRFWDDQRGRQHGTFPREDIAAALSIVTASAKTGSGRSIDLSYTDLRGHDLTLAHLEYADLTGCVLDGVSACDAHFEHAQMFGVSAREAFMAEAHFEFAFCERADFRDANLAAARFENTCLSEASLVDAFLHNATLWKPNDLEYTDFEDASLLLAPEFPPQWAGSLSSSINVDKISWSQSSDQTMPPDLAKIRAEHRQRGAEDFGN